MTETIGEGGLTADQRASTVWHIHRECQYVGAICWRPADGEFKLYAQERLSAAELRDLAAFLERVNKEQRA